MGNELLYLGMAVLELGIVFFFSRMGKAWLYVAIGVNMILISALGAKLIEVFSLTSNVGNVFYAAVFFATYLVIEHYDAKAAIKGLWIGFIASALFGVMSVFTLGLTSIPETKAVADAMNFLFRFIPRVALGSLVAYFIAGYFNIWLYSTLKAKLTNVHLWLRTVLTLLPAQFIDSVLFFSLAFYGIISNAQLLPLIFGGWIVKVAIGILAIPFAYLSISTQRQG